MGLRRVINFQTRYTYIGYHQQFVSIQYLSSGDVSKTNTQSDSIANGVKMEPSREDGEALIVALAVYERQ